MLALLSGDLGDAERLQCLGEELLPAAETGETRAEVKREIAGAWFRPSRCMELVTAPIPLKIAQQERRSRWVPPSVPDGAGLVGCGAEKDAAREGVLLRLGGVVARRGAGERSEEALRKVLAIVMRQAVRLTNLVDEIVDAIFNERVDQLARVDSDGWRRVLVIG